MRTTQRKRPQGQLRQGQLITTFGPGAMTDLPERSVLIAGLDDWVGDRDLISEPRLSAKIANLLQIPTVRLETPPSAGDIDDQRVTGVRAYRFPEWFVTQDPPGKTEDQSRRSRFLVHARALARGNVFLHPETRKRLSVVPVRFVRACRLGHIGDIDWYFFLHGNEIPAATKVGCCTWTNAEQVAIFPRYGFAVRAEKLNEAWRKLRSKRLRSSAVAMVHVLGWALR